MGCLSHGVGLLKAVGYWLERARHRRTTSTSTMGGRMAGSGERQALTANQLRRLAEAADGQRGKTLQLKLDKPGGSMVEVSDVNGLAADAIVVSTPMKNPNRPIPAAVHVTMPDGSRQVKLDTLKYDMVLWGEAAAEKFLVPYYTRFYSEVEMEQLRAAIVSSQVIALAHVYPAHVYPTYYEEIGDSLEVLDTSENLIGLGFIPLSRWFNAQ
jgi:hypothetical protein